MKTTYEWLLHNVGNEANYLTILNLQHQTNEAGIPRINVMARTKDFNVINLTISPEETEIGADRTPDDTGEKSTSVSYFFNNEESVIAYLSNGQAADADTPGSGIRVLLQNPADDAGEITFPTSR